MSDIKFINDKIVKKIFTSERKENSFFPKNS